jgi:hypothetical protein
MTRQSQKSHEENELEAVETGEEKKGNDDVPRFDPSFGARGSRSMGVDEAV